jgi:hypothetical protein
LECDCSRQRRATTAVGGTFVAPILLRGKCTEGINVRCLRRQGMCTVFVCAEQNVVEAGRCCHAQVECRGPLEVSCCSVPRFFA